MIYNNVEQNLYGSDRTEALKAMSDDEAFDRWMSKFHRERAKQEAEMDQRQKGGGRNQKGLTKVSQEEYLSRSKKEYGAGNAPWEKKK